MERVAELMGVSTAAIQEALWATTAVAHETADWEHHECPMATPMERLLVEEDWQARALVQP